MENWNNLNNMISLERNNYNRQQLYAQQMIELSINNNKEEIIKLFKKGATPNCYADLLTPLMACIDNGHYDLAKYLLNAGAMISYRNNPHDLDAFLYALKAKDKRFLELFVSKRCVLSYNEENEPALIFSTKISDATAVEILLSHYAIKVNERDGLGNTALHYNISKQSMTQDDIDIGKMLIAAGADTNATNLEGKKPEDLIADFAARAMLLDNKLDVTLPINEDVKENENDLIVDKELGISKTHTKKLKI
jgi:ankyrin repeat protein